MTNLSKLSEPTSSSPSIMNFTLQGKSIFCHHGFKSLYVHVKLTFIICWSSGENCPLRMDFSVLDYWLKMVENPKVHRDQPAVHRNGHIPTPSVKQGQWFFPRTQLDNLLFDRFPTLSAPAFSREFLTNSAAAKTSALNLGSALTEGMRSKSSNSLRNRSFIGMDKIVDSHKWVLYFSKDLKIILFGSKCLGDLIF